MRYHLMENSTTTSNQDTFYKDVLSANFLNIENEFNPSQHELIQSEVKRFDLFIFSIYGSMKYMDLILELNNIEHRSVLYPGYIIFIPSKSELDSFLQCRRKL